MKLTKELLKKWEACWAGAAWFENFGKVQSSEVMEGLLAAKRLEWANWLIVRILNRKDKIRFAIFAAEQVLELFETEFPKDKRPRHAIEEAKAVLKKNNKATRAAAMAAGVEARAAAGAAARAAGAAARAAGADVAHVAADWAYSAARSAAAEAAWSAAAEAAGAAAWAVWFAACDSMKEKIIRYGLKLHLKGGL